MAALLAVVLAVTQLPGLAQSAGDDPLPTVVFVARADNPVDALGASSVAGAMGGVVLLTRTSTLEDDTRAALVELAPDLVILAGGENALSPTVQQQIEAIPLPTRRVAGATRVETAAQLSAIAAEFGFGRPLLTGTTVDGDAGLSGTMSAGALEVGSDTQVDNLNASLIEGFSASDFLQPGDDIDATTLEGHPSEDFQQTGDLLFATVAPADGDVAIVRGRGVTAVEPVGLGTGNTLVTFERDITDCTWLATYGPPDNSSALSRWATVSGQPESDRIMVVIRDNDGNQVQGAGFHVQVICP